MNTVTLIGAGNVAWHLAQAFYSAGFEIVQVWSRTALHAESLASLVNAHATDDLGALHPHNGVFIFCLNDDAVPSIIDDFKTPCNLALHTSGTHSIDILGRIAENYGVLYPLQTFTKGLPLDVSKVPFLIEASSEKQLRRIEKLASSLSPKFYRADSLQRQKIHIAAVFACNYANLMYTIASELLDGSGFDLDILRPLIAETTRKVLNTDPGSIQTGPARRGDLDILRKHIDSLASNPDYAEIYRRLAQVILNKYYPGLYHAEL